MFGHLLQTQRSSGTKQCLASAAAGAHVDEQPAAVVRMVGHQRVVGHAAREARQDGQHVDVKGERRVRPGAQRARRQAGRDAQRRQQVRQDVAWRARAGRGRRAARSGMPGDLVRGALVEGRRSGRPVGRPCLTPFGAGSGSRQTGAAAADRAECQQAV